ncbi:Gfo/Idh/MocA family protein [Leadbettera azotonutricia]|uniref:Putative glucose--fructose oxidoreductase (Gfor) n=1 Tax=Leadbettera azotonutricia (strain ATCC BAA-888 / DSM 13862 / ZAS-9) TaxID=545695 RepID=F5Y872_LEAAZ|nr:Gfo/Idh/MocA family oxidoreductase [Leadbettera azotonutricia]AEF82670.1 putative glucose--fructose oxidoreductase (gfor) [Leadbettera azotonutricia ZAS-9]
MSSIKVGIAGAGSMAPYHYDGFTRAGAEVIAVADMDISRAEAFGKGRGIKRFYKDLSSMLAGSPELDAVSVITPNKFHKALVVEALENGRHVYCEKPPALNAAEAQAMLDAAKKSGKTLMFNFNNRARPESGAMKRYIDEGRVGKINSAQAFWIRRTGVPRFGGWFTTKALSGGGALIDLPHMLDLALHFMDFPEPDYLLGTTYNDFMNNRAFKGQFGIPGPTESTGDVETSCHAMVTFKTGQSLMIRSSWAEMVEREMVSVTFQGQKAGGKVERLFGIDGRDETSIDSCRLFAEEYGNQVDLVIKTEKDESMGRIGNAMNFIDALAGRAKPLNTPEQALILMKIIDALYESASTGKPVKIA